MGNGLGLVNHLLSTIAKVRTVVANPTWPEKKQKVLAIKTY